MPILEIVRQTIQRHHLLPPNSTVLVAVSGGNDSLALLHLLADLCKEFSIRLHIVSLDHAWRGAESAADAAYVGELAQRLGLPYTLKKADLNPQASQLEATARRARFDFFNEVAQQVGASHVVVGHHADDQAETVLMHLLRGSGLDGLTAMAWQSPMPHYPHLTLVRPLLGVRRTDLEAYCAARGLVAREDATNSDTRFLRNRIRLELVPHLEQIAPQTVTHLVQLADLLAADRDFLHAQTLAQLDAHATRTAQGWQMPRAAFLGLPVALQRRVLREMFRTVGQQTQAVTYERMGAALACIQAGQVGQVIELEGARQVRMGYDEFSVVEAHAPLAPSIGLALPIGAVLRWIPNVPLTLPHAQILLSAEEALPEGYTRLGVCYLPQGCDVLTLRTRQSGDRIALAGLGGHTQKLKDWMINVKIPQAARATLPLAFDENRLVAVLHIAKGTVAHPYHQPTQTQFHRHVLAYRFL